MTITELERREAFVRNFPPPYRVAVYDQHGREIGATSHDSLSSLELEVGVAEARIRDEKDAARSFKISHKATGQEVPRSAVLSKFDARAAMIAAG